ncbi:MAG: hypothetical protein ACI8P3_002342 [Saprospiraceae bacterium]|jgi:hypothetical protein
MKPFTKLFCLIIILSISIGAAYSQLFDGYALYNHSGQNTTYMIDKDGDIAHSWSLPTPCNYAVLLMDNGNIMRGGVYNGNQLQGAAIGGMIQEFDPEGNLVWSFTYSNSQHVSHHDISLMPDGNVLLIAWEVKSQVELQAMGYSGNASTKYPTHFIEVSQDGTGGEIVWEWHLWDHMIQDVDPDKPNYGVIADHPELMNINVSVGGFGGPGSGDWFHVNGIDYNADLDQIVFSSRFLSEVFIIDHSTSSEEAAGHTGGNSGKGGDLLYRWGNPANYGITGAQAILGPVHDSRWIPNDGRPRGGFIHFFNNDGNGSSSTVDALELPFAADGYNYEWTPGEKYEPASATWRHICLDDASGQSAANSMPNGNTFVALSQEYMYEVDLNDNVVWQYAQDPLKAFRFTCDHPGVQALINLGFLEAENCIILDAKNVINHESIRISPNPSNGVFSIEGLLSDHQVQSFQVFDLLGNKIQELGNVSSIDLSNQVAGVYIISIRFENNQLISKSVTKL